MLTKRVSNASKPVKRIRTKNVDSVKPPKVQSISTTIPINFDVDLFIDPTIGVEEVVNDMVTSFDTISMLNSSETFIQLAKTFKMCKIRKVHGCIDVTSIPSVVARYTVGTDPTIQAGEMPLSNTLLNCAMLRTVQLGKYFGDYETGQEVKTYDDVVSIGSNIFQAMIPGTSVHLSPEIQASGMMERSQYLDTNIFMNLKMLKNYNATQYFIPTFYIAGRIITPKLEDMKERIKHELNVEDPDVTIGNITMSDTNIKLSCQFYIDVIMKDLENNYASKPTAFVYSNLLCKYVSDDENVHIASVPLFEIGTRHVDDLSYADHSDSTDSMYIVEIAPFVGTYEPDTNMGYRTAGYLAVYIGPTNSMIYTVDVPTAANMPVKANYNRYYVRLDIRSDKFPESVTDVPSFTISGNNLYDDLDVKITSSPSYVCGNLAFMYNRTI